MLHMLLLSLQEKKASSWRFSILAVDDMTFGCVRVKSKVKDVGSETKGRVKMKKFGG